MSQYPTLGVSKSSSQRRMDAFLMSFEERRGQAELIWIKWIAIRKRQQRQLVLGKNALRGHLLFSNRDPGKTEGVEIGRDTCVN